MYLKYIKIINVKKTELILIHATGRQQKKRTSCSGAMVTRAVRSSIKYQVKISIWLNKKSLKNKQTNLDLLHIYRNVTYKYIGIIIIIIINET